MALNLTVPVLEDHPQVLAETRPQQITEFINTLSTDSPLDAAVALLDEIRILNRQVIAAETRLNALEAYWRAVHNLDESLAEKYCNLPLPLPEQAKKNAAAAEALWLELSYGYKLVALEQQRKHFNPDAMEDMALILQRAIAASGQLLMVFYHTYFTPPANIWSDLHQLHFYAAQHDLQDMTVPLADEDNRKSSVSLAYKQALLMALADPQHLEAQDIRLVASYIAEHAQHTQIQGLAAPANPAGVFLVRLEADKGPLPYVKREDDVNAETDVLFITMDLVRLTHRHLQALQTGMLKDEARLLRHMDTPLYQHMLFYLVRHWGAPARRVFSRTRENDVIELGIGLGAAHYFLNGGQYYRQPSESGTSSDATDSNPERKPSRWQILNISAGGLGLRKFPHTEDHVQVGDLICVKNNLAEHWSIGAIRWANHDRMQQLNIGTQLIAPVAHAVGIRQLDRPTFERAILLPELPTLKQETSMIAAPGTYSPARVLELDEDGRLQRIMIMRLVESTARFERFQFARL